MYSIYSNMHYMLSSHKKLAVITLNCRVLLTDVGSIVGDHVLVVVDASVGNVLRGHRRHPEQPLTTNHQTASLATLLSVSFIPQLCSLYPLYYIPQLCHIYPLSGLRPL